LGLGMGEYRPGADRILAEIDAEPRAKVALPLC
jgi:hypothetical protein